MINIKIFDSDLLKIDKNSYKNIVNKHTIIFITINSKINTKKLDKSKI